MSSFPLFDSPVHSLWERELRSCFRLINKSRVYALELLLCIILMPNLTFAQSALAAATGPALNASVGYSYVDFAMAPSARVGMNGLDSNFTADLLSRVGIRLDVGYARASNVFDSGRQGDVLSYLGGPVFYPYRGGRLATYLQALVGGARVTGAVPLANDLFLTGYANKLAWAGGGGVEYGLSSSLRFRAGADYLRTAYFDQSMAIRGYGNVRVVYSVVYYFGPQRKSKFN